MPNQSLTTSMSLLAEHSVGAYPTNYEKLWVQNPHQIGMPLNLLLPTLSNQADGPVTLYWTWQDQSPDGAAQFDASITISSNLDPRHQQAALSRYLSMYFLSRLNDESINEACQSLADIYRWQLESEAISLQDPEIQDIGVITPQMIERQPFQPR